MYSNKGIECVTMILCSYGKRLSHIRASARVLLSPNPRKQRESGKCIRRADPERQRSKLEDIPLVPAIRHDLSIRVDSIYGLRSMVSLSLSLWTLMHTVHISLADPLCYGSRVKLYPGNRYTGESSQVPSSTLGSQK